MTGERSGMRKQLEEQSTVKFKEPSPGPIISKTRWSVRKPKFENHFSTIVGINDTTLSYVVSKNDTRSKMRHSPTLFKNVLKVLHCLKLIMKPTDCINL